MYNDQYYLSVPSDFDIEKQSVKPIIEYIQNKAAAAAVSYKTAVDTNEKLEIISDLLICSVSLTSMLISIHTEDQASIDKTKILMRKI
jgi:hypothetical protein